MASKPKQCPSVKAPASPLPNMKRTIEDVLSPKLAALKVVSDSPPAKIMKTDDRSDAYMAVDEQEFDGEPVENTEVETLTEEEITQIIAKNYDSIGNGIFSCPIESCSYELKSPKGAAKTRRQHARRHLNTHKAEKPYGCDEKNEKGERCTKKFTQLSDLQKHKFLVHPKMGATKCLMPGCMLTVAQLRDMHEHLLFVCIRPDFAFCKECKMQISARDPWKSHWTSDRHKLNCELLQRRGEVISPPPTQDIHEEMKRAAKDPVEYKNSHRSDGFLGSVSLPTITTSKDDKVEKIQSFEGFVPTPEGSVSGVVWCSELGVPLKNTCRSTILHNLLSGPQEKLLIHVTINTRFGGPVRTVYEVPVVSSSTCTTEVFNSVITCRKHTHTQGTREVGMVLEQNARRRFAAYGTRINQLIEAREKFEAENQRDITTQEFAALRAKDEDDDKNTNKQEWQNCRKIRHFAAKDCSLENLIITIIATYPQTKEGRTNCIHGEAYYQYAIKSCHEASGGLDEKPEHANHEKRSEQLSELKVYRGEGTQKEQELFPNFVNKKY